MAESTRLVDLVQLGIDDFLAQKSTQLQAIAPDLGDFVEFSREFLAGGKRFRALFCYWGWQAVASAGSQVDPLPVRDPSTSLPAVVLAAASLEVFHGAALVHDDIIDNSSTRRGSASAHKRFEELHRGGGWRGSSRGFGQSAALLLGDLLLGWSDELFDSGLALLADREAAAAARGEFNSMRTEVTAGQYLDILEEKSWASRPEAEALPRAHRVIVYKSAKYSVEAPLAIGATLGGGSLRQVASLREFGLPLGVAYQLRDDLLGVFGDPEVTGKPAGDDLREGKRTVLIALARTKLQAPARRLLDELLGDSELDAQQVSMLQTAIRDSGAVEHAERVIDHNVNTAKSAIEDAPLTSSAKSELLRLADTVIQRVA